MSEENKKIKGSDIKTSDANNIYKIMDTLINNSNIRGFYLSGEAGNSKSFTVYRYLKENKVKYTKITARVSSLSLFMLLQEKPNDLFVFDDVNFDEGIAIDILKGALNEDGVVHWRTTSSSKPSDVKDEFVFKGKIIIITNNTAKATRKFYPLLSRCFTLEHRLSFSEYKKVARQICETAGVPEAYEEIEKHLSPLLEHRDLRIVNKAIEYYKHKHIDLISGLFVVDEELNYIDVRKKENVPSLHIRIGWCKHFAKSRRSYFRCLRRYKKMISENSAIVPSKNGLEKTKPNLAK